MLNPAYNQVELTAEQKRMWIDTRSALLWTCPAFTAILFSMLNPSKGEMAAFFIDNKEIPVAATDGENLILNVNGFFKYTLTERVFIVAHEIMHAIYNHCAVCRPFQLSGKVRYQDGTSLDYSDGLMNIAMDLVINDALVDSRVGTMPKDACHDKSMATSADSCLDAYKKIYKVAEKFKGKGFDILLPPGAASGKDPGQAAQGRSQAEWDTAVAAAITAAKVQGKLPGALERLLSEVLDPTVPWQDLIRAFFARKVGAGSYNWRRPDRRLISREVEPIYAPQRAGNGCGEVVVAIDTSGSIGQRELNAFFGELRGILDDVKPEKVYVIWCDAKVHKVDEIEDAMDIDALKPHGGGGTDFKPPFDWVDENDIKPEALVYLTDGYGSFPVEPNYPVIWGDIAKHKADYYPFGDVVQVEIK